LRAAFALTIAAPSPPLRTMQVRLLNISRGLL
jgi:hypothetical protein